MRVLKPVVGTKTSPDTTSEGGSSLGFLKQLGMLWSQMTVGKYQNAVVDFITTKKWVDKYYQSVSKTIPGGKANRDATSKLFTQWLSTNSEPKKK